MFLELSPLQFHVHCSNSSSYYHSCGLLQRLPNLSCCFGTNYLIQGLVKYIDHEVTWLPLLSLNPAWCLFFFLIKFYWNMLVHLPIVYGCFCAMMAELHNCDRLHGLKTQNIYSLALHKWSLPTSGINPLATLKPEWYFKNLSLIITP